jgi:hypothetical protein
VAVEQAEVLGRPETVDRTSELIERHRTVKLFAGAFLNTFEFRGAGAVQDSCRRLPSSRSYTGPANGACLIACRCALCPPHGGRSSCGTASSIAPPMNYAPWPSYGSGCERETYGSGSRQFRDFDSYLIPSATFDALREKGPLPLAIETDFDRHIEERRARLDTAIEQVTVLARQGELPQVRLNESGLIISPLKAATPPATEIARRAAYDRLPRVKITDLLLEVDAWTGFSECFIHRRSGREPTTAMRCSPSSLPMASISASRAWRKPAGAQACVSSPISTTGTSARPPMAKRWEG